MRIRYSRDFYRNPKNTLITIDSGNMIYFGIARCNKQYDTMKKEDGRNIAFARASAAVGMYSGKNSNILGTFFVDSTGLSGYSTVENANIIVKYFESLDHLDFDYRGAAKNCEVLKCFEDNQKF